jgi:hypothetical protein
MRPVRLQATIASLFLTIALSACGGGGDSTDHSGGDSTDRSGAASGAVDGSARADVFVIVLENHSFGQVIGNPQAPFINNLTKFGTLFTRYSAISHPSLPNYLAILGGSTFGIDDDCTDCAAKGGNLALQLSQAGITWRAYMEGMPSACYLGAQHARYVKRHNPFLYFPSITSDPGRCAEVVPAQRLASDARHRSLPAFAWITPDLCHDGHDCSIAVADRYLSGLVPTLFRLLSPDGFLVLTFDEGGDESTYTSGGGRIATIVAGPRVRPGATVAAPRDHYSLLRTLENAFGVPYLRRARGASDLAAAFRGDAVPSF